MLMQLQELNKYYDERSEACVELESVVSKLLRLAVLERRRKREMLHAEELYRFMQRPSHVHGMEVGPVTSPMTQTLTTIPLHSLYVCRIGLSKTCEVSQIVRGGSTKESR